MLASKQCPKQYAELREKRSHLARELGFGEDLCKEKEPRPGEVKAGGQDADVAIDRAVFCKPEWPIRLKLAWSFAGCGFTLSDPQKDVLRKLGGAAGMAGGRPFVIEGFVSRKPIKGEECFKTAQQAGLPNVAAPRSIKAYAADRLDRDPWTEPQHAGLSFLRALAVAEGIASGMTSDPKAVEELVKSRFHLVASGVRQASDRCHKEIDPSKQEQCFALDQRVELEATLEGYIFDAKSCL